MADAPALLLVGGGSMGRALVGGLLRRGWTPERIAAADPDPDARARLARDCGLERLHRENSAAYAERPPAAVLFAVKPQALPAAATGLAPWMASDRPLLISIAAGVRAGDVARWTGRHCPVARAMPNTPALVGAGLSVLYAAPEVPAAQRALAESVLAAVGRVLWVRDEALMDAATAVSGSGPAYFFEFLDAQVAAAQALGLEAAQARTMVLETARGALRLAAADGALLAELRRQVTSPGGTTEAAGRALEERGFREAVRAALEAACRRARELGDEHGRA